MKEEITNISIGKRIIRARNKAGISQYKLHLLTGISTTQLSAYENGKKGIGVCNLKKIADATGFTMEEIYFGNKEEKPIISSYNEGKLIINCITALFECNVISSLPHENPNEYMRMGLEYYYQIGFCNYEDILDDFIKKMVDFERKKNNYPNPIDFKNQIIEAAAKMINERISNG